MGETRRAELIPQDLGGLDPALSQMGKPLLVGRAVSRVRGGRGVSPSSEVAFLEERATLASEHPVAQAKV